MDEVTKRWTLCAADERAVANGCTFDEERAEYVVNWIERYCHLYEGETAGQLMTLDDWQREVTMRLFGWVKLSEDWGRRVRRFRRAGIWIPKKNGKSPTLAAWGLYLLIGDGEQGQKIYSAAKDGKQAMISHQHAMEMVRMSPELSAECSINKSTGQITHTPTRSFYKIVAGDNVNSQEGLNGSVMIDETHVVNRRLAGVLKGAGISRSEPFQIEVSTAGSNPDGYGKGQRDYGIAVEKGEIDDEQFFFREWSAPQDLGEEELAADPLKYGRMANPTMGRIVKPGEFIADYKSSVHSIDKLSLFKMYRLNIWQRSSNPWLSSGDWSKCERRFTEEDLLGEMCVAGMDLSKTRDMTALVLVFPGDDEGIRLLPFFWMPESQAHAKAHLAPFLQWAKDGWLELTPGDVLDYGFLRTRFRELAAKFQIVKLVYDPTYAEETTQALSEGVMDAAGNVIEDGTGVERIMFKQTLENFTPVIEQFERLVIAGKANHNGHPILSWQAGHVHAKRVGRGRVLVKPPAEDVKKIDGVVASVMGLSHAKDLIMGSVYEQKGNLSL